jgi:hypothetical protein
MARFRLQFGPEAPVEGLDDRWIELAASTASELSRSVAGFCAIGVAGCNVLASIGICSAASHPGTITRGLMPSAIETVATLDARSSRLCASKAAKYTGRRAQVNG